MFAFKKGKICRFAVSGTEVVFKGGVTAACINRAYTCPSYEPNADNNVSSWKSNASTNETATGRIQPLM